MSWKIPEAWRETVAHTSAPRLRGVGPRLSAVGLAVPEGSVVADIGADHGLLCRALLGADRARFTYAMDTSDAALEGARAALADHVEAQRAAIVLGDGFDGAPPGTLDCAVLAGTGSATALGIVRRGLELGHRPQRIIFQPSGGEHDVREEMLRLGYGLVSETLVAEGRRLFMVLVFEWGTGVRELDGLEDRFVGPFIKNQRTPLLGAWLEGQARWLEGLLEQDKAGPDLLDLRARLASITALQRKMRHEVVPPLRP